jgi:hypothetical protein
MEESAIGENKARSEKILNITEINVSKAKDHPSQPFLSENTTIKTHKPVNINPAESSAQINHQEVLNQNAEKKPYIDSEKEEKIETTSSSQNQQKSRGVNFQCWNCEESLQYFLSI